MKPPVFLSKLEFDMKETLLVTFLLFSSIYYINFLPRHPVIILSSSSLCLLIIQCIILDKTRLPAVHNNGGMGTLFNSDKKTIKRSKQVVLS